MTIHKSKLLALLGGMSLLLVLPVVATAASLFEGVGFSGFGTIGLLHGGDEALGYRRDISRDAVFDNDWSFETDTLLGFQVNMPLTEEFDAAVQLVARDRVNNTLNESLEWAYLRYRPTDELTLRGGRLGTDLFMLSEYRNLGFSYLWARPPVEFYGPTAFDHYDGADIAYEGALGEGVLQARLFTGRTKSTFVTMLTDIDITLKPVVGATLGLEFDRWQARLGLARLKLSTSDPFLKQLEAALQSLTGLWPEAVGIVEDLDSKGKHVNYFSVGLAYDHKPWTVQTEISYIESEYNVFNSLCSAYLSLGRRIGPVTVYGLGALAESTEERVQVPAAPPFLAGVQQQIQTVYDLYFVSQRSLSLGMRWDIRHNLSLKAQWDHTWVDKEGGGLWLQKQPLTEERQLDTFSLNLNFVF